MFRKEFDFLIRKEIKHMDTKTMPVSISFEKRLLQARK